MALILTMDVCLPTGHVAIADAEKVIDYATNTDQQKHAQWLHVAIDELLQNNNITANQLTHIAVTNGPGSYTGIRVGLSAAKGLAYALQIPIIAMSNLALIAYASKNEKYNLYIPLVDARRQEVFAGLYNKKGNLIDTEFSHIIDENSFSELLANHNAVVCGSAAQKFKMLAPNATCQYSCVDYQLPDIHQYAMGLLKKGNYINHKQLIANYIKPYYTTNNK